MLFLSPAREIRIDSNPSHFLKLSLTAMRGKQEKGENNPVYKYCPCVEKDRPGKEVPLMPLESMSFGLIEYTFKFFTCTNIHQVITFKKDVYETKTEDLR